jgi:hypothetical protein
LVVRQIRRSYAIPRRREMVREQVQILEAQPPIPTFSSGRDLTEVFRLLSHPTTSDLGSRARFFFEIRPPTPRSEATVCAVTRGNITELAATTFVALFIGELSLRTAGYDGEAVRRRECQSTPIGR